MHVVTPNNNTTTARETTSDTFDLYGFHNSSDTMPAEAGQLIITADSRVKSDSQYPYKLCQ